MAREKKKPIVSELSPTVLAGFVEWYAVRGVAYRRGYDLDEILAVYEDEAEANAHAERGPGNTPGIRDSHISSPDGAWLSVVPFPVKLKKVITKT